MARRGKKGKRVLLAGVALELITIVGLVGMAQPELLVSALKKVDSVIEGRATPPTTAAAVGHIQDAPEGPQLVLPPVLHANEWLPVYFDMAAIR